MGELFAALYDPLVAPLDAMGVHKWREWAVRSARGRVLEVGIGTGLNLPHYPAATPLIGIDPDRATLRRAQVRGQGRRGAVGFYEARAEELPFTDESFDVVVGTLVFCTIGDPSQALGEARRVLAPGGTLRLVEHVRVKQPLVAGMQDLATPVWKRFAGGCHLNRDTLTAVEKAGFHIRTVHHRLGGFLIGIHAIK